MGGKKHWKSDVDESTLQARKCLAEGLLIVLRRASKDNSFLEYLIGAFVQICAPNLRRAGHCNGGYLFCQAILFIAFSQSALKYASEITMHSLFNFVSLYVIKDKKKNSTKKWQWKCLLDSCQGWKLV